MHKILVIRLYFSIRCSTCFGLYQSIIRSNFISCTSHLVYAGTISLAVVWLQPHNSHTYRHILAYTKCDVQLILFLDKFSQYQLLKKDFLSCFIPVIVQYLAVDKFNCWCARRLQDLQAVCGNLAFLITLRYLCCCIQKIQQFKNNQRNKSKTEN